MGQHKIWRAQAKKMRRKRIRQKRAQERDEILQIEQARLESSPRYQLWLKEQELAEQFQLEEEMRLQRERHLQWEKDEEIAQKLWKKQQERIAQARAERAKQEMRIREEWEQEQKKIKEEEELKMKKLEEKERVQEKLMKEIDEFIASGRDLPASVSSTYETHPDKPVCPFFTKTGACRFGDHCSRNHPRPGISHVLLFKNFYFHFHLNHLAHDEHDSDIMLEFEDSETYEHFVDFYEDVLPEFQKIGDVTQFRVCCNFEPHLRGNVYIEYSTAREAVLAYQKFCGRWYGGRQLNVEFTNIGSWRAALCGLFPKRKCPKGKSCNFLHTFRNPGNAFSFADRKPFFSRRRSDRGSRFSESPSSDRFSPDRRRNHNTHKRWRWSESPEPENTSPNTTVNIANKNDKYDQNKKHGKSKDSYRNRSEERERSRRSHREEESRYRKHRDNSPRISVSHRKEKRRKHQRSRSRSK